jgi:hypothetical protein
MIFIMKLLKFGQSCTVGSISTYFNRKNRLVSKNIIYAVGIFSERTMVKNISIIGINLLCKKKQKSNSLSGTKCHYCSAVWLMLMQSEMCTAQKKSCDGDAFICLPLFSLALPVHCVRAAACARGRVGAKIASPAPLGRCKVSFETHPACSTTRAGTRITHVPNALIDSHPVVCARRRCRRPLCQN